MDPCRFVDVDSRVVEELLCPVCGTVPMGDDEPLQLPCQHLFCRPCIEKSLLRKSECPVDRSVVQHGDLRTSRPIANVISRLKVAPTCCPASHHQSHHILQMSLRRHDFFGAARCVYPARTLEFLIFSRQVTCDNADRGCPDHIEISDLARHVKECSYAPVECSHCGEVFSQR